MARRIAARVFLIGVPLLIVALCFRRKPWDQDPFFVNGLNGSGYNGLASVGQALTLYTLFLVCVIPLVLYLDIYFEEVRGAFKNRNRRVGVFWLLGLPSAILCIYLLGFVRLDWERPADMPRNPNGKNLYGFKLRMMERVDAEAIRAWLEENQVEDWARLPEAEWVKRLDPEYASAYIESYPPGVKIHLGTGFEQTVGIFVGPEDLVDYPTTKDDYTLTMKIEPGIWVFSEFHGGS